MTYEQALANVLEYLKDSYVPVQMVREIEFSDGWYFCYESTEYVETQEFSARLVGNGPLLVDRDTGELLVLGTSQPVELSVEDYVREKRKQRCSDSSVPGSVSCSGNGGTVASFKPVAAPGGGCQRTLSAPLPKQVPRGRSAPRYSDQHE